MNFLPKDLENIIIDYKIDLDNEQKRIDKIITEGNDLDKEIKKYIDNDILNHIKYKVKDELPDNMTDEIYDFFHSIFKYLNKLKEDGKVICNYKNNIWIEYEEGNNSFALLLFIDTNKITLKNIDSKEIQETLNEKIYIELSNLSLIRNIIFYPETKNYDLLAYISFDFKHINIFEDANDEDELDSRYELFFEY